MVTLGFSIDTELIGDIHTSQLKQSFAIKWIINRGIVKQWNNVQLWKIRRNTSHSNIDSSLKNNVEFKKMATKGHMQYNFVFYDLGGRYREMFVQKTVHLSKKQCALPDVGDCDSKFMTKVSCLPWGCDECKYIDYIALYPGRIYFL